MYILTDDDVIYHPGHYLFELAHKQKISVERLAEETGVDADYISGVFIGKNGIGPDFADRLYGYLGIAPDFWLRLQKEYDDGCRRIREKDLRYRIVR